MLGIKHLCVLEPSGAPKRPKNSVCKSVHEPILIVVVHNSNIKESGVWLLGNVLFVPQVKRGLATQTLASNHAMHLESCQNLT